MWITGNGRPTGLLTRARSLVFALGLAPLAALGQSVDKSVDPNQLQELDDDRKDLDFQGVSLDRLEDMDVVRNGEVIGEVDEILGRDDEVRALVIEYGGNRLGIGEREVVVAVDQLRFTENQDRIELLMSEDELDLMASD